MKRELGQYKTFNEFVEGSSQMSLPPNKTIGLFHLIRARR
jgi:hypothetical protein